MSGRDKLAVSRPASAETADLFIFAHLANKLRSDINEVVLRYDADNQVATIECHRVSSGSRVAVGKMYTRSKMRAHEMLMFNGFYECAEDRWRRYDRE